MARRRITDPTPTVTIHISQQAYEILEQLREGRLHEPKYRTVDRVLEDYIKYRTINYRLEGELEERDYIIQDLKSRLEASRQLEISRGSK